MGFEIDNANLNEQNDEIVATSSMKIGTVTFIKENTKEFAALGHSTIKERNKKSIIKGLCYDIEFGGINKGTRNETGNIVAKLDRSSQIGQIYYDSNYGIFGRVDNIEKEYEEVETACWYDVKKGKASIFIALDEEEPKSYEVEITKIDYINSNKNIKVKITDNELIAKTGGIVQGMSGTPLIQDRKTNRCNKLC